MTELIFDICVQVIARLRELLSFMSLSTYTQDYYDVARRELKIGRGLQSVGETRFATIYWSVDSVLQGYEAFKQIVRNPDIGIENAVRTVSQRKLCVLIASDSFSMKYLMTMI